jgi:NTE family protein
MALFTPVKPGNESVYPESLKKRLRSFASLNDVSEAAMRQLLSEADWFSLPGGTQLPREGENDRALFLVVTGSLGVFVHDEGDGPLRLVAHVPAGETVGEMSLLSGESSHSATLVALRDTELLRLGPKAFDGIMTRYPRMMLNLLKIVVRRLRETTRHPSQTVRPKTFAVVPMQDGLEADPTVRRIAEALIAMGAKSAVLDSMVSDETTEWFNRFETEHDIVFYKGDRPGSTWTQFCLRQADRVLYLAYADEHMALHPFERRSFKMAAATPPELLLVHRGPAAPHRLPRHVEVRRDLFGTHHHLREGNTEDVRRLARFVAGRAINIVLAGGGARGFAHIGVLKALAEAGVPFDYVSGTSMGGIIAAGLAMEWSIDELSARVHHAFVENNPLSDFTLPLIALFRGAKVSRLLRHHFGEVRIEDLAKPYFCVSADLTTGRDYVHRSGPLWRALRASVALPGILPPVTQDGGHLLVDGGVMNNLPVDVVAAESRGPIVAVDVSGEIDLRATDPLYGERSVWSLIWERMKGSPSIISILMRAGTVGSTAQRKFVRDQADLLFEPPLEGVGMRDWKAFDRAVQQGYVHALLEIERRGVPLSDTFTAGPALAIKRAAE